MTIHFSRKMFLATAFSLAALGSASADATAHIETQANAIRIQTFTGVSPILCYTGSVCSSGHLTLDPSDTPDRQKLLWAAVLSAKAMSTRVSFDYDFNGDDCVIRVFAVMPN